MRVTLIALGSRGDVQPYVALGRGLHQAGHHVTVLASADFHDLVTSHGLQFADMGGRLEDVAQGLQDLLEQGQWLKILPRMGRAAQALAGQAAAAGLAAAQGADLLVAGLGGLFVGMALAEKLGLPLVQAYLYPFTPTREFPSILTPLPQTPLTAWANGPSHHLARQMMWQMTRAADNQARVQVLGLPPAPRWGPFAAQPWPTLYGYSPRVIPRPQDWAASIEVTGYWFLPPPADWAPPADLVAFLRAGPPPVYIGFGSMTSRRPGEAAELVLAALARAGQRGVLYAGWGGLKREALPEHVFMTSAVPHTWLFPQMAAVVHHGGAGTTAAGLAAGVPSILTPFMGDQPFWGRRVAALGVGPQPIPRSKLTVEGLARAIQQAVGDPALRQRAADLGAQIRAEDGVGRAVAAVEAAGRVSAPRALG
ncbi:MAG: glycosyltransferase family 1 protein [Anaerolineales bacterium]|nr:glycosyltransferase family 1 protein [Anaerolineales bacterium]